MSFKIGQGYDVHKLSSNLPLWIGGVNIPHTKGIVAHSDGDILIHAIIDSILGACNLGDLGQHFPGTVEWKNASGLFMLDYTYQIVSKAFPHFRILNIDSTIILEEPKVVTHIKTMKDNISHSLNMDINNLSIKATTTDKLGPIGLEEGIAAQAVCLVQLNHE
jgi:2-C-methyl-D-erythritol 2,4-cyclodiphosphate synthase